MQPCCVLNGLQLLPIPPKLYRLDGLSKQFIQCAKSYQVVVRLGTYTAKVPIYNSLKACKGNILLLPLERTMETLDKVEGKADLPNPELYMHHCQWEPNCAADFVEEPCQRHQPRLH